MFLTVRPNTTYQDCTIDNKSHYQVLVSVVTFRVYTHIFHMNSYVSASTGNTVQIVFLILFIILIMFSFSSSKWNPLKGNFSFRITKMLHGTEFGDCSNALTLTFVGLKSLYCRCYVGYWLCSEESYCTDKYLIFCDKRTAINILKFQGRMFGFCLFGRTRFKSGNVKYNSSAWLLHMCCSRSQRLNIFITQFGVSFLGYI